MNVKMKDNIDGITGQYRITRFKAGTKEVIHQSAWIKNLIVSNDTNGLNIVARQLAGDTTYPIEITGCKMGSGTTTPTINDTDIETDETVLIARSTILNNIAGVLIEFLYRIYLCRMLIIQNLDYFVEASCLRGQSSLRHIQRQELKI